MSRTTYRTNQKKNFLTYLENRKAGHFTAIELYEEMKQAQIPVSLTTTYRMLDALVKEGKLVKFSLEENAPACYAKNGEEDGYHFICLKCHRIYHVHCHHIQELNAHVYQDHGFRLMMERTVFYGTCKDCQS